MKKFLFIRRSFSEVGLLFSFSILFVNSQAQTSVYHPFPDSNATWCAVEGTCGPCSGPPPECNSTNSTYQLNGNTTVLIKGKYYHKLYQYTNSIDWTYYNCNAPYYTYDSTPFYIRQDTALRKVWIYDGTVDTILIDFNLHVGDSLDGSKVYWANGSPPFCVITSIDSILINGQYRTKYNYQYASNSSYAGCGPYQSMSIVEGIGSLHGFLFSPPCFEWSSALISFMQDGKPLYPDTLLRCKALDAVNNLSEKNISISISPNPSSNKITISNYPFSGKEARVEIYNMIGERIFQSEIKNPKSEIDISSFVSGVYIVQVTDGEKVWRGKMIKE